MGESQSSQTDVAYGTGEGEGKSETLANKQFPGKANKMPQAKSSLNKSKLVSRSLGRHGEYR